MCRSVSSFKFEGVLYLFLHEVISKHSNICGVIGRKEAHYWLTRHLRFRSTKLLKDKILYDMVGMGLLVRVNQHTYKVLPPVYSGVGLEGKMIRTNNYGK